MKWKVRIQIVLLCVISVVAVTAVTVAYYARIEVPAMEESALEADRVIINQTRELIEVRAALRTAKETIADLQR